MTSPSPQFIPQKKPDAGSLIGASYLTEFEKCPRRWFRKYYNPVVQPETGELVHTGIEPLETAPPLLTGGVFHAALESYYLSGIRDGDDTGEYNLEAAMAGLDKSFTARRDSYLNEEIADTERTTVQEMVIAYYDRFGPKSPNPDYPKIKVICDGNGQPYVEREWVTDLGYSNYYLTCKTDLFVSDQGYGKVMEHKTSVASFIKQTLNNSHTGAQFTGEIYTLKNNMPVDAKLFGVLVNVVQKNRSPRSKYDVAERETTNRTDPQLYEFANWAVDVLRQIDDRVGQYEDWINSRGVEEWKALSVWFPTRGTANGECNAYNRPCDYSSLCKQPDRANQLLGVYRPRTKPESELSVE